MDYVTKEYLKLTAVFVSIIGISLTILGVILTTNNKRDSDENMTNRMATIEHVIKPSFNNIYKVEPIIDWNKNTAETDAVETRFFRVLTNGVVYVCAVPNSDVEIGLPKMICQRTGTYTISKPQDNTQRYIDVESTLNSLNWF